MPKVSQRVCLLAVSQGYTLTCKADYMRSVAPFLYPKKKELH